MLECDVEDYVVAVAEQKGYTVRKLKWIGRNGAPDRLFVGHGRVFFVEFKKPGKKEPDALQSREIKRLREGGAAVYVINSIEAGLALLD